MRRAGWEAALSDYLTAHSEASLDWERMDCGRFAAGAVEAMTGADFLPQGRYSTARGAARVLRRSGHKTLSSYMDSIFEQVPPSIARRGDVVMCDGALGVCIGADALFLPLEGSGLVRRHRREWTNAWAVR